MIEILVWLELGVWIGSHGISLGGENYGGYDILLYYVLERECEDLGIERKFGMVG